MRILAFSDIHDNLSCVKKMRHQEKNDYDAVVIAGDIGSEIEAAFFEVMSSFNCPVLYIYGNWDGESAYAPIGIDNAQHLHLSLHKAKDMYFAGFSGCQSNWGKNPISADFETNPVARHEAANRIIDEIRSSCAQRQAALTRAFKKDLGVRLAEHGPIDKRTNAYRNLEDGVRCRYHTEQRKLTREKDRLRLPRASTFGGKNMTKQEAEDVRARKLISREVAHLNRKQLLDVVRSSGVEPSQLMLVTHDRLYRLDEDLPGLKFHVFGHRHGFKHTVQKGTHILNVSALGEVRTVIPRGFLEGAEPPDEAEEFYGDQSRNVNVGTYCVIDVRKDGQVEVVSKSLPFDANRWALLEGSRMYSAPCIPEDTAFHPSGMLSLYGESLPHEPDGD